MKPLLPALGALLPVILSPSLAAGQTGQTPPTRQAVYSLYVARHDATVKFAELEGDKATEGGVRKLAQLLAKENQETGEKIRKLAEKEGVALTSPSHDTTEAMLREARSQLEGKQGRAFDSTFAVQAHGWLTTLLLDNNRNVSARLPDGDLKKFAQAYSGFVFRESVEAHKVKQKFAK